MFSGDDLRNVLQDYPKQAVLSGYFIYQFSPGLRVNPQLLAVSALVIVRSWRAKMAFSNCPCGTGAKLYFSHDNKLCYY